MNRPKSFVSDFGRLTRFGVVILMSIVALVVLTLGLGGNNRANAAGITINTPAGLVPGDTFRIAFVTDSTTTATSTNIADYNAFVIADATAEAGGGSVTYNGTALTFSAIASTPSESAFTNIGQTGAPVYLTNGTEVAASDTASAGGLWSGTSRIPQNLSTDLSGFPAVNSQVWTGTNSDGSIFFEYGLGSSPFGSAYGLSNSDSSNWAVYGYAANSSLFPLYGISQSLTVVPEPASIVLCLSAAGCAAVCAYVRRRRADIAVVLLVAVAVFVSPSTRVWAGFIPPSGLVPGSQYEIAFVTAGGIAATSSAISTYNTFATSQAALDTSLPSGLTWNAIVSTASENANVNAPSSGSIPVYDTQGNLITNPGQSLYGMSSATPGLFGIEYDQNGNLVANNISIEGTPSPIMWTGSSDIGVGVSGETLGSSNPIMTLVSGYGQGWLDGEPLTLFHLVGSPPPTVSSLFPVYALSSPITFTAPEPSSIMLAAVGCVGLAAWGWRRQKRLCA
jgi:hypothetical protein